MSPTVKVQRLLVCNGMCIRWVLRVICPWSLCFFIDFPANAGQSLTKISNDGKSVSWRAPNFGGSDIYKLFASPSGKYVAFTYGAYSINSGKGNFSIGIFRTNQETWSSLPVPFPSEGSPIVVGPINHN